MEERKLKQVLHADKVEKRLMEVREFNMGLGKPKQAQWVEETEQAMRAIWCLRANRIKQNRIA